jgi:hypothetical protein
LRFTYQVITLICVFSFLFFTFQNTTYADTSLGCKPVPGYANCFNGFRHDFKGLGVTGVYADIFTPAYPANYASSSSSAWAMVTDNKGNFVQSGWAINNSFQGQPDGVHFMTQATYANGQYYIRSHPTYGPGTDTTHGYRVSFDVNTGYWNCSADGVIIGSFTAYPVGGPFTSGQTSDFSEEIASDTYQALNSAYAGINGHTAIFSNIRAAYNGATIFSPSPTTYFTDENYYFVFDYYSNIGDQSASKVLFFDNRY